MRRNGFVLGITLIAAIVISVGVAAANPAITVSATRRDASGAVVTLRPIADKQGNVVPPLTLLGEYVIVSGQGFPPNQPVMASLVARDQVYPLAFQDLMTSGTSPEPVPMTDATGALQNLAFALPAPGQVASADGEIFVSAGSATARAPIAIDDGVATTVGRGDKIAVSIGAAFLLVSIVLILLLVRGLPVYPIGQTTARGAREREET